MEKWTKKPTKNELENYKLISNIYNKKDWQYFYLPKLISCENDLITEKISGIKYNWSEHENEPHYGGEDLPVGTVDLIVKVIKELDYITNGDFQYRNLLFMKDKIAVIDWESLRFSSEAMYINASYFWLLMFNNIAWRRVFIDMVREFLDCEKFRTWALYQAYSFVSFWKGKEIENDIKTEINLISDKTWFKYYWNNISPSIIEYQWFEGLNQQTENTSNSFEKLKALNLVVPFGSSLLDVGCSTGYFSIYASLKGANVTGIDIDECAISKAKRIAGLYNTKPVFLKTDISNINCVYDTTLCLSMFHYIEDKEAFLDKLKSVSKKVILETPVNYDHETDENPKRFHVSEKTLLSMLEKRFRIIDIRPSNLKDRKVYHLGVE